MTAVEGERANVLVVEDDDDLLGVLARILRAEGFEVHTATDGERGLDLALDLAPSLVIADIGLPARDGVSMTRELRARGFSSPVLMLTARSAVQDRVSGLDAGADDYLPKPFEYPELVARVRALLRRASLAAASTHLQARDLTVDPITRRVTRGGREVTLSTREYALLEYLMRHVDRPVTRQQISEHVWHQALEPGSNVVDVYISYLRDRLGDTRDDPIIRTIRRVGYMIAG